ncbi:MAG: hypothetical protein LBC77_00540 [Spirochaetaceae bacterium]|nr:hypothetical protein [Spirochaetaceae bacterium]
MTESLFLSHIKLSSRRRLVFSYAVLSNILKVVYGVKAENTGAGRLPRGGAGS